MEKTMLIEKLKNMASEVGISLPASMGSLDDESLCELESSLLLLAVKRREKLKKLIDKIKPKFKP